MTPSLLATLVAGALLSTVPVSAPVDATRAIQRCMSRDGTLAYTDNACAASGAQPMAMPSGLMARIAQEDAVSLVGAGAGRPGGYADAATALDASGAPLPGSRRAAGSGCARTPTQLAMDLQGALLLGDVNRVAESYDWAGMSNPQGQRTLDRLQQLIGRPVIASRYYNAQIMASPFAGEAGAVATASAVDAGPDGAGVLQLTLGDDAHAAMTEFAVHRYAGCYFVRF